jgi:hypothetical protein
MKLKTLFGSILTCGLVAVSASAQSSLVDATSSAKARTALADPASVKLVSSVTSNGKEILVLSSGQKVPATLAGKPAKTLGTSALSKAATKAKAERAGAIVSSSLIRNSDARMGLAPGQIVVIGKTSAAKTSPTAIILADTVVVAPPARTSLGLSANPLAATIERQVFAGDLPRDTAAASSGLTLGTVANAAGATEIGPNGFPVSTGTAAPQSGANPIGPNGFPLATASPFTQTGITRSGAASGSSVPATAAAAAAGVSRAAGTTPGSGRAVGVGAPAISTTGAAASMASPR